MSDVTQAVLFLCTSSDDKKILDEINAFLDARFDQVFVNVSDNNKNYGGYKVWDGIMAAAAFNHFDAGILIDKLKSMPWDDFDLVQLVLQAEHDQYRMVNIKIGESRD